MRLDVDVEKSRSERRDCTDGAADLLSLQALYGLQLRNPECSERMSANSDDDSPVPLVKRAAEEPKRFSVVFTFCMVAAGLGLGPRASFPAAPPTGCPGSMSS